jgi:methyl-accepting chemotaxis protein
MKNWTIKSRVFSIIALATIIAVILSTISIIEIRAFEGVTSKLIISFVSIALLVAYGIYSSIAINNKLASVVDSLGQASDQLNSASSEVAGSGQSLASSSSQQAARIEETSSSLEELSSQIKVNNENTNAMEVEMGHASELVEVGLKSVGELIVAMESIKEISAETSKIIKTIDDIAFQTNLLALNAAVEAARAGEAGKGFAVVAEEVRNLAQRSAEAAKNTSELIQKSQMSSENGAQLAETTAENWHSIAGHAGQVGTMVQEISIATEEQASAVQQITSLMSDMDANVQQNASNAEESASAAEELSAQAAELKHVVNDLKVMTGGGGVSTVMYDGSSDNNISSLTANDFIEVPDSDYHQPSKDQIKSVNMAFEH